MEKITQFRTKYQREYDQLSEKAQKDHEAFEKMMAEKELKLQMKGRLTEDDLNEVFMGLGTIARNGRKLDEAIEKIRPGHIEEKKKLLQKIWDEEKAKFLEEEHGIRIIK